eukprot:TRINITY_DN13404_c0_g1_i2.p2 TRINITY_DN13404_c0_g1~~TRINITY_DN13404_c0_g1_i2.p2  ORF type:complete len:118 (+),score=34.23 TRINITY_DN13404_c0_g1_i2:177-530(+)
MCIRDRHYYTTFDSDRSQLAALYTAASTLHFEGTVCSGQEAIIQKLTTLGFQTCKHDLTSARLDVQVTSGGGIFILCTGQLLVDAETHPSLFTETFVLQQAGASWYIHNHMFRLNNV